MANATEQMSGVEQVNLAGACADCHIEEVLDKLDRELVGLKPVKTRIREIAALLMVDRLRRGMGLSSGPPSLHMSFTGNPGTGKTTVALRMAEILHRLGYIRRPEVISVTRDDLVGQYIGHTAPKTKEVLKKAMGGVLFIDEAYYLYRPENERDYGQESIEILLQVMENQREDLVVILAGYKDKMDRFFQSNPGMRSRIAHHIDFPDYTAQELMEIARLMLGQQQYQFSAEAERAFYEYIQRRMKMPQFANARSIRNALDRARLRHANRVYAKGGTATKQDLMTLQAEDILASRVFREGKPDEAEEETEAEKKTSAEMPGETTKGSYVAARDVSPGSGTNAANQIGQDRKQGKTMQTNSEMNITNPGAAPGFGGMPRPAAPAANGARGQSKRRNGHTPPAPLRVPPTVVNGRCEFGQCEHESKPEAASNPGAMRTEAPPAPARPARVSVPTAPERKVPVVKDGRCEFGQCDTPSTAQATDTGRTAAAAVGRGDAPDARPNARLRGPIQYPPKVADTTTYAGQRVTGIRIGRGDNVTGDEPGAKLPVTGSQYLGTEGGFNPRATGVKVGAARTAGGQVVTGTQVRSKVMITGDESNLESRITGEADQTIEDDLLKRRDQDAQVTSQFPRRNDPHGHSVFGAHLGRGATARGSRERVRERVHEQTAGGLPISGVAVGRSPRVTGDEPGSCRTITGDQYMMPAQRQPLCDTPGAQPTSRRGAGNTTGGARPDPVTGEKVTVSETWSRQRITGVEVEYNPRVTGDEPGVCAPITGTPYVGPGQYEAYCETGATQSAARRVAPGSAVGNRVTGDTPINAGHVTGTQRGAELALTGTPYYRADVEDDRQGNVIERINSRFSVRSPQREAQLHSDSAAVRAPSAESRMTGSFTAGAGKITGNQEFHFSPRARVEHYEKKSRITGEGKVEGPAITGYAWSAHPNVTGTEGYIAAERNPSERAGKPHGFASARRFAERAHGEVPPSKITGSSGNTMSGATVTLSGGARA